MDVKIKKLQRTFRHKRIRKKSFGTTNCPRVCVRRSNKNIFAQVIDDSQQKVLFGLSTLNKDVRKNLKFGGNIKAAEHLGEIFSAKLQEIGIKKVCFDRGGYLYHGRVKAFADAARKSGLEF